MPRPRCSLGVLCTKKLHSEPQLGRRAVYFLVCGLCSKPVCHDQCLREHLNIAHDIGCEGRCSELIKEAVDNQGTRRDEFASKGASKEPIWRTDALPDLTLSLGSAWQREVVVASVKFQRSSAFTVPDAIELLMSNNPAQPCRVFVNLTRRCDAHTIENVLDLDFIWVYYIIFLKYKKGKL